MATSVSASRHLDTSAQAQLVMQRISGRVTKRAFQAAWVAARADAGRHDKS
jgi:hypothetical protein